MSNGKKPITKGHIFYDLIYMKWSEHPTHGDIKQTSAFQC